MKKGVRIDWDEVHAAFSFHPEGHHAVLDLETGTVRWWIESGWDGDLPEDVAITADEIDEEFDRYASIERPESWESFRWMERFAAGVADDRIREALLNVLGGRRPFRRFKDALAEFFDTLEQWYAFEEECLYDHIADWARMLPVEILNVPVWMNDSGTDGGEDEPKSGEGEFATPTGTRKLSWRDMCPACRKYDEADRPPDDHPLTVRSGLTEGDLCRLNRDDQADSDEDFQCGAFEPKGTH